MIQKFAAYLGHYIVKADMVQMVKFMFWYRRLVRFVLSFIDIHTFQFMFRNSEMLR